MIQKIASAIFVYLLSCILVVAQTAALLPNALQQYFDANGNPLSGGTVTFYYPGTMNFKPIWQDALEATPYSNPLTLNAAGEPPSATGIYGQGTYRQIVKDISNNLIWDAVTAAPGTNSASSTGDGDLVGTIKPWAGLIAPNQYAFSYGQQLSRTTYSALFAAITLSTNVVCTNTSNILTGIADTSQIPVGSPIELSCVSAGTTVVSKTSSSVTLTNPSNISLNAVGIFFPFGNGDGSTTFTLPDLRGNVVAGRPNMGGIVSTNLTTTYFGSSPLALNAIGGSQHNTFTIPQTALQNFTLPNTLSASIGNPGGGGYFIVNPNTFVNSVNNSGGTQSNVPVGASGAVYTSITVPIAGSITSGGLSTPLDQSTIQPTIILNYIIKILPDVNSAIANGVTSFGGMSGSITCGTGLICTGNNVSVSQSGGTVNAGSINQIAFYGTNGTTLNGETTIQCSNMPTLTGNVTNSGCATTLAVQAPGLAFIGNILNVATSKVYNITFAPYNAPCNYNAVSDGAMGSGSTTLTSATANFSISDVGKYIAVGGAAAAGANLFTTVASFTNSTTVVLTAANASGGAVSGKFVEYGNDDTSAIQAAWNAVVIGGGTLYTPSGKRCLLSRLNGTNVSISVDIRGDGVNGSAWFPLQVASYGTSSGHMLDFTGSAFIQMHNMQIGAFYELAAPTTAINLAQVASGVSNRFLCDGIYISGQFTLSTLYNYGVPSSECRHSDFYNYKTGAGSQDVIRFSSINAGSVTSSFATVTSGAQSTSDWTFTDVEAHKFAGAGANNDVVTLDGTTNINFIGGVISGGANEYVNFVNANTNINFIGVTMETESQPVVPTNGYFLAGSSTLTGLSWPQTSYILGGSAIVGGTGALADFKTGTPYLANSGGAMTAGATYFVGTGVNDTTSDVNAASLTTGPAVISNLQCFWSASPGTGHTFTTTFRSSSVSSNLTCNVTNAANSCSDQTHYAIVPAATPIDFQFVSSASANTTRMSCSVSMQPY